MSIDRTRRTAQNLGLKLSQQLTISSLFSALALVTLALFARAGEMPEPLASAPSLVQIATTSDRDA